MEVLCQLHYLAVRSRLFILQNASSEWNFGGRRNDIQESSVARRAWPVDIYMSAKTTGPVRAGLLEKVSVVRDIHSIVIRDSGLFGWSRFLVDHQGMHINPRHVTTFTYVSRNTA